MTPDERLDMEFAYTPWEDACKDLYTLDLCCRRPKAHEGEHAAGFGDNRARWN